MKDFHKVKCEDDNKSLLHQAVKGIKKDVGLWLELSEREIGDQNYSVARSVLTDAVKRFPYEAGLWIRLAETEIFEKNESEAKRILEKALTKVGNSEIVWLMLASIEKDNPSLIQNIVDEALICFADNDFEIKPKKWIDAADFISGVHHLNYAVIRSLMGYKKKNEDDTVEYCMKTYNCKLNCLEVLLRHFPIRKRLWVHSLFYEDSFKRYFLLRIAITNFPKKASLRHLILAKEKLNSGELSTAIRLYEKVNADSKWNYLIAEEYKHFKQKVDVKRTTRMNNLRQFVQAITPTVSFFEINLKNHLKDEWLFGEHDLVQSVLTQAVLVYDGFAPFWLMKGMVEIQNNMLDQAKETFENGIKLLADSKGIPIRLKLAELEEKCGNLPNARNVLNSGRSSFPDNVDFWIASIRLEARVKQSQIAQSLLTQAIEKLPESGELWAEAIFTEKRSKRGRKVAEALNKCENNEEEADYVMLATAKFFFNRGEIKKSRKWFNKTIEQYQNYGDAWIYFYKLEKLWGWRSQEVMTRFMHLDEKDIYGKEWSRYKDRVDYWGFTQEELMDAIVDEMIDVKDI